MILPLGDEPNPRGVPVMTYGLIAANVAVFVLITIPLSTAAANPADPLLGEYVRVIAQRFARPISVDALLREVSAYDLFVFRWGFRPAAPSVAALFTSLFLHAGLAHLFGNMLFLWIYGDNVEHRLGGVRFVLSYLAAGVAATLFHTIFDLTSVLPLVGASGAISGVLGFYFVWFPRNRVRLLFFLFPLFMQVITVPARLVLGLYLIADNLLPFLVARGAGGVAHGAHIGGFIAGLGVAWLMNRREVTERPVEYRAAPQPPSRSTDIADALAGGRYGDAAVEYFSLSPAASVGVLEPSAGLALASWLQANGHEEAALVVYRRLLRDYPNDRSAAAAHIGIGLIQLQHGREIPSAYQHFVEALDLDPPADLAATARAALDRIAGLQKFQVGRPYRRR